MDETGAHAGKLQVTVALCVGARAVREWSGELGAGARVADALRHAGYAAQGADLAVGIWGKAAVLSQALHDGDRVEVCRPLKVDPKVARRERFARQGARSAGLFARKSETAEAGGNATPAASP